MILGCGFGGINLAKALKNQAFDVTIIDRNNFHTFQPLLYQVATGGLEPDSIAYPVRKIIRGFKNVRFQMAEVNQIDAENRIVKTSVGEISFDYLVIATGSSNNFFNFDNQKENLLPLKTLVNALDIRSYIMQNLEQSTSARNDDEKLELINIGIIGGGATGIELAGALAEMRRHVLPKDFPEIDFNQMSITLFEASGKLLGSMSENASKKSLKYLQKLDVNVMLNSKVRSIDHNNVYLEDGTIFDTNTVVWTAGVKCIPIFGLPEKVFVGQNRITVNSFNQINGYSHLFAIGDISACLDEDNPKGLPMLAPVAMQQANLLAKNLIRLEALKPLSPFKYRDRGVMATVGRNMAVADLPRRKLNGRIAWFAWLFIHLMLLVGFRNKVVTFVDWAFNYFSYDQPLGLIIRKYTKK